MDFNNFEGCSDCYRSLNSTGSTTLYYFVEEGGEPVGVMYVIVKKDKKGFNIRIDSRNSELKYGADGDFRLN